MKETTTLFYIKKGKKFMKGHGYTTLRGYKFSWTTNKEEARKMELSTANSLSIHCNGRVIYV
jgi:hypothetical protein